MSNELAVISEDDMIYTLQSSLFIGASADSVKMVLMYCKAAKLDVMQKPVHIVPMWDAKLKKTRDVVMPGIGLYRTQASRTGEFAGMTEPEFGPMITEIIGGASVTFPEYAKCTVKRELKTGTIAEYTAIEYWMENYAVKGGQERSIAPNAMWSKRPRGQLAKCAQAQALRLAFPELGAAPSAEEMEGKVIHQEEIDITPPAPVAKMKFQDKNIVRAIASLLAGEYPLEDITNNYDLTDEQLQKIKDGIKPVEKGTEAEDVSYTPE